MRNFTLSFLAASLAVVSLQAQDPVAGPAVCGGQAALRPETAKAISEGGGAGDSSPEALAQAAQNPVAKLISAPFQNNFNFGIGPNNVTQWVLNLQPVIPLSL